MDLLTELAKTVGGSAFELDVEDTGAMKSVVDAASKALRGLDAVVFTSTVVPFAHIEDTDLTTWMHAFNVNAVGANNVLRAALPHLSENGVVLVASSNDVGRPRAGVAAYGASKAALDEILHSWRGEHPELSIVRVGIGPPGHRDSARRRSRPPRATLQVVGGTRATPRADVESSRRRQHLGVARHHGTRQSERGARNRATGTPNPAHRRRLSCNSVSAGVR
jgi:NADP-dependent 3-hydroxy acid dehydrogenase YdfG